MNAEAPIQEPPQAPPAAGETPEPDRKVVMQIILTKDGKLEVEGVIHDELLAYGLLQKAINFIQERHIRLNASRIMKPNENKPHGFRFFK